MYITRLHQWTVLNVALCLVLQALIAMERVSLSADDEMKLKVCNQSLLLAVADPGVGGRCGGRPPPHWPDQFLQKRKK